MQDLTLKVSMFILALRLSIVPAKMFSPINKGDDWKAKFKAVSDFYVDHLPNPLSLDAESRAIGQAHCDTVYVRT